MTRRELGLGECGAVTYRTIAAGTEAVLGFRDLTGRPRRVTAVAPTRDEARLQVLAAFHEALATAGDAFTPDTQFKDVAERWIASIDELAVRGGRKPTTADLYRRALALYVLPYLGDVRLGDLTTSCIDGYLQGRLRDDSFAVAKLCRTIVGGICAWLVRQKALQANPVREASPGEWSGRRQRLVLPTDQLRRWLAELDDLHAAASR